MKTKVCLSVSVLLCLLIAVGFQVQSATVKSKAATGRTQQRATLVVHVKKFTADFNLEPAPFAAIVGPLGDTAQADIYGRGWMGALEGQKIYAYSQFGYGEKKVTANNIATGQIVIIVEP